MSIDFKIVPMEQWWHLEHSIKLAIDTLDSDKIKNIRKELTHPDSFYFVALVNGGVKGFAGYKTTHVNPFIYEFPWCVVHPDYQRKGLGRALTGTRIQEIRNKNGQAIILTTGKPEVYEKYGFELLKKLPGEYWANHFMMMVL